MKTQIPKDKPVAAATLVGVPRFDWRDPYHAALTLSWRGCDGVVAVKRQPWIGVSDSHF